MSIHLSRLRKKIWIRLGNIKGEEQNVHRLLSSVSRLLIEWSERSFKSGMGTITCLNSQLLSFETFQKVLIDSERFHTALISSERFQKVPKGFQRFQKVPKGSIRFYKVAKGSIGF